MKTRFILQRSRWLFVLLLFIHIGAMFCICFILLAFLVKTALFAFILLHFLVVVQAHAFKNSSKSIVEFWPNHDGSWSLKSGSKVVEQGRIVFPAFVSTQLIVLNFETRVQVSPMNKETELVRSQVAMLSPGGKSGTVLYGVTNHKINAPNF